MLSHDGEFYVAIAGSLLYNNKAPPGNCCCDLVPWKKKKQKTKLNWVPLWFFPGSAFILRPCSAPPAHPPLSKYKAKERVWSLVGLLSAFHEPNWVETDGLNAAGLFQRNKRMRLWCLTLGMREALWWRLCRTKSPPNVSCGVQNVTCWVSNVFHLFGNVISRVQNASSGLTIMMTNRCKG